MDRDGGEGPPGNFICSTKPFGTCGTATFADHVFYFARPDTNEIVCSFRMVKGTAVYFCNPFVPTDSNDPSAGVLSGPVLDKNVLTGDQLELYQQAQVNREFIPRYKNFTGGSEWLAHYPAQPPQHYMWRADYLGQEHWVTTRETHFVQSPPPDALHSLSIAEMKRDNTNATAMMIALPEYRAPGLLNITLTVVSVAPRIFQIDNFLSDVEVDQ